MAAPHLTIQVDDAQVLAAHARQAAPDTGPLMPRLGEYLQRSTQQRFKTQTAPDGTPWAPLNPQYAQAKKYNKGKILTLRGYLRRYIHYQVQDANTVAVGSNQKYAAIHQFGGIIKPRKGKALAFGGRLLAQVEIPARPYLGLSTEDTSEIRDIIRAWLVERGSE